jgi:hypothetical protein
MHINSRSWGQWWPIHLLISLCNIGVLLFLLSQYCRMVNFFFNYYLVACECILRELAFPRSML